LIKILFVCTGNICRSPLAEGILRDKLLKLNIPAEVDSCGFESFHVGDPPDNRAQTVAGKRGIDLSGHRARLFSVSDFDRFDLIYAMDSSHYNNILRIARNASDIAKVDYLLNVVAPGQNQGVPDPWYHDLRAFEKVYLQLDAVCDVIAEKMAAGNGKL
jgi:protein-tyrosine phosphatase